MGRVYSKRLCPPDLLEAVADIRGSVQVVVRQFFVSLAKKHLKNGIQIGVEKVAERLTKPEELQQLFAENILPAINKELNKGLAISVIHEDLNKKNPKIPMLILNIISVKNKEEREKQLEALQTTCIEPLESSLVKAGIDKAVFYENITPLLNDLIDAMATHQKSSNKKLELKEVKKRAVQFIRV